MARLIALIPRLTAPLIVRGDGLPSFGTTVQWPGDEGKDACEGNQPCDGREGRATNAAAPKPTARTGKCGDTSPRSGRSSTLTREGSPPSDLRPYTSVLPSARRNPEESHSTVPSPLQAMCAAATAHRAIFFGEQHHQPKVLSAQMQVLYHVMSEAARKGKTVHVVFEQWSLADQPELAGHVGGAKASGERPSPQSTHSSAGSSGGAIWEVPKEGSGETTAQSGSPGQVRAPPGRTSEGFNSDHYMMLVQLVREMNGHVWGGFPPRDWAKMLAHGKERSNASAEAEENASINDELNDGLESVRGKMEWPTDQEKMELQPSVLERIQNSDIQRYERTLAALGGAAHQVIPPLPAAQYSQVTNVGWAHRAYLRGMFAPDERPSVHADVHKQVQPPEEHAGFLPAQALKDTFFAHTVSTLLARDEDCIVVAICGAGHCEWSLGAPERVRYPARDENALSADYQGDELNKARQTPSLRPFIFLSKPDDAGFWPARHVDAGDLQDSIATPTSPATSQQPGASPHADDQWMRKQADAILLYEWMD